MNEDINNVIIIGSGYFGRKAAATLLSGSPKPDVTVVDYDEKSLEKISNLPVKTIKQEGLLFLNEYISQYPDNNRSWIIPAVPIHLAFEWVFSRLQNEAIVERLEVPPSLNLPNQMVGSKGELYSSFADFLCPSDCPEPETHCTVTGKTREKPLYQLLLEIKYENFVSRVIKSVQLGRGVGGYRMTSLNILFEEIKKIRRPVFISTACRCHGVTSALEIKELSDCLWKSSSKKVIYNESLRCRGEKE